MIQFSEEDKAFAKSFMRWTSIDSAGATQMLRWIQRNQDPGANYCLTCGDAMRALHTRCQAIWEHYLLEQDTQQKRKRNGNKKNTNG